MPDPNQYDPANLVDLELDEGEAFACAPSAPQRLDECMHPDCRRSGRELAILALRDLPLGRLCADHALPTLEVGEMTITWPNGSAD